MNKFVVVVHLVFNIFKFIGQTFSLSFDHFFFKKFIIYT